MLRVPEALAVRASSAEESRSSALMKLLCLRETKRSRGRFGVTQLLSAASISSSVRTTPLSTESGADTSTTVSSGLRSSYSILLQHSQKQYTALAFLRIHGLR